MLVLILLLVLKVCSSNAVEAISGSTTTLTCPRQGSSFEWTRLVNVGWSTLQQGAKYGNVNTASLIIYNVDPSDEGGYICKADRVPSIVSVTVIVIAIEGSTTTLTCPLQSTSFIWIKHTTPDVSILQQGAKYGGVNTRHLAIYNVDPHDGGRYLCRTTDVPPDQTTMNIVFRAIVIWGSTITLTCTLPGSNYYWQKRTDPGWSSRIQAGAKYGNVNSRVMTIYNVQTNDGGRYRCGYNATIEQVDVSVTANGNWGSWGDWAECTKTCAGGTKTRKRYCDNPTPANDGSPCQGLDSETVPCSTAITCTGCFITTVPCSATNSCPVYGNWSTWGGWSQCTKTCVGGTRTRHRTCDNPVNGSSPCLGLNNETVSCSTTIQCPEIPRVKTTTYETPVNDNSPAAIGIGSTAVVVGLLILSIYIL